MLSLIQSLPTFAPIRQSWHCQCRKIALRNTTHGANHPSPLPSHNVRELEGKGFPRPATQQLLVCVSTINFLCGGLAVSWLNTQTHPILIPRVSPAKGINAQIAWLPPSRLWPTSWWQHRRSPLTFWWMKMNPSVFRASCRLQLLFYWRMASAHPVRLTSGIIYP